MSRLLALEAKRQSAMEQSREIQACRSGLDDEAERAFAIKLQQVAFLTPAEEVERNTLRDQLDLPSASISDEDPWP